MEQETTTKMNAFDSMEGSALPGGALSKETISVKTMEVIATIGPIMTIPQIVKMWTEKSAAGISLITWMSYVVLAAFWLYYGYSKKDKPIMISNALWVMVDAIVIAGILIYG